MAYFAGFYQGMPTSTMLFPEYYHSIESKYDFEKNVLDGTWLKVDQIGKMS